MARRSDAQFGEHGAVLFYMGGGITPRRIYTRYQHITPLRRDIGGIFGGVACGGVRCGLNWGGFRLRALLYALR